MLSSRYNIWWRLNVFFCARCITSWSASVIFRGRRNTFWCAGHFSSQEQYFDKALNVILGGKCGFLRFNILMVSPKPHLACEADVGLTVLFSAHAWIYSRIGPGLCGGGRIWWCCAWQAQYLVRLDGESLSIVNEVSYVFINEEVSFSAWQAQYLDGFDGGNNCPVHCKWA